MVRRGRSFVAVRQVGIHSFHIAAPLLRAQPRCAGVASCEDSPDELAPHRTASPVVLARSQQPAASSHGNLAAITWPLLLTMTLMVMLSMASISTLSALRAYVNGEGRWSKAQSQAIADLRRQ
jgi:hypothetical protein